MNDGPVLFDVDGRGVATITFNRPDALNTYNDPLLSALDEAVTTVERDASIRLVLLRGNGKHFCAGADIKWLNQRDETADDPLSPTPLIDRIDRLAKPTIALVHGACVGGGVGWIVGCDVVIAAEDSTYSIPEVRLGFVAGSLLIYLRRALSPRDMRRYVLSGERFNAQSARQMGLVHELCPAAELDAVAQPVIDAFLRGGPDAIAASKAMIIEIDDGLPSAEMTARLNQRGRESRMSEEAAEGRASFLEKRDPGWYRK